MTRLLDKAIQAVRELPAVEQDAIATLILDEVADEELWDEAFARSQGTLEQLADKARAAVRAGRVRKGGMDEL